DKRNKSGGIDRSHYDRPGNPTPVASCEHPAAVVKRREAPRLGIHPRPAPRRDVHPVADLVRRPSGVNASWYPDGTVIGVRTPVAVFVEIVISIHIARDVPGGGGVVFTL